MANILANPHAALGTSRERLVKCATMAAIISPSRQHSALLQARDGAVMVGGSNCEVNRLFGGISL
jgi:hypothetical protein